MHNMHAGLSQVLAVPLMAERREPATHRGRCAVFAREIAGDASGWRASGGGWFGAQ